MKKLIRNFSIIAHIDHGKTTLTDRLLLRTNTIAARDFTERLMDSNPIEKERGITIKLAPVRMMYSSNMSSLNSVEMNLIDTPGHVDFSYEVSRSLAAGEGALLLVDASQGVQAQTLSNYYKAKDLNLIIIPVLNKIDLPIVDLDRSKLELMELFNFTEDEIMLVSAKSGQGIDKLLDQVVKKIPSPSQNSDKDLSALVFSSQYHPHKGVIVYVRVMTGTLTKGNLAFIGTQKIFEAQEIGIFSPQMTQVETLFAGEVGYIATGLKEIRQAQVGDTVTNAHLRETTTALPGYTPPLLMVYMDLYPIDGQDYQSLLDGMEKLALNDAALQYHPTHSKALGNGLRVGFLGVLHAEIVQERLQREFNLDLIATTPSVRYEVMLTNHTTLVIHNPEELPDPSHIQEIREPIARVRIFSPKAMLGGIFQLCEAHRGSQEDVIYFGDRAQLIYTIPLPELIVTFHDELKSITSGFGSMEYELSGYQPVKAVKLSILINKEPIEALSQIVAESQTLERGKIMVKKLKEVIPRELFEIPIQASIGGKVIARETIKAFRKDVTAKLYGGDATRRKKLLEKQKKGKERRKQFGRVEIPQAAFMAVLKK